MTIGPALRLRLATPADVGACGRLVCEASGGTAARRGAPCAVSTAAEGVRLADVLVRHPRIFGLVAECAGEVVGCAFLDERDPIRGAGPVAVAPRARARGVGRGLVQAVLERARGAAGVRLLDDASDAGSVARYAELGCEVREPVLLMAGRPAGGPPADVDVRLLTEDDLDACAALCARVHGADRSRELADALARFAPMVAVRGRRVVAYASAPAFWPLNHAVAETDADLRALLLGAAARAPVPLAVLLPVRQAALFRWCLTAGLRAVRPMTLLTLGQYRAPRGAYVVSVLS